ncbi:MAG: 5-formyltetrahydrofolate cyclo-ligase, partial [Hyphomicrobiaceae bacterium]
MSKTDRNGEDQSEPASFASPPCFMHELDPAYGHLVHDAVQARDVSRWRKAERERLIAARLAIPMADREQHARLIANELDTIIERTADTIVSLFWPFRGEPDLRSWMTDACA